MNNYRYFLCILGCLLYTGYVSSQENFLLSGIQQYELRNFELSANNFESYLKIVPTDLNVKTKLAYCYKSLGQTAKALNIYESISNESGVDSEVFFEYGELLRSQAEFDLAKLQFQKYSKFNPSIGEYFMQSCDYAMTQLRNPSNCNLKNLETNSSSNDIAPIHKDNEVLLTDQRLGDMTIKSVNSNELIKATSLLLNPNTPSQVDKVLLEESAGKGNISFNQNNDLVVYSKNTVIDLSGKLSANSPMAIFIADINEKGSWTNSKKFPFCIDKYSYAFPSLTKNGKTVYFASNMPGGYGGFDIYTSTINENGEWSAPENLGTVINTPGNEISPNLIQDNLYFSSDWHNGFGGLDIFKTTNYGISWSDVENMGTCVNSTKDDYNFILDNEGNGYFTSNRQGGKGGDDNYVSLKLKITNANRPTQIRETNISAKSPFASQVDAPKSQIILDDYIDVFDDPELSNIKNAQDVKVYFVQITALTNFTEKMEERFKKYSKYGDIYKLNVDGITKIRIGVFPQLNKALTVLKELRKTGLKDAFVVGDVVDETRMSVFIKSGSDFTNTVSPVESESNNYKIRVAEFKAPDWFDASKVNDLGRIEHWTKSGITIIILGAFNENDARETLNKIKSRGFKDAYIVKEEDGKLYRHD